MKGKLLAATMMVSIAGSAGAGERTLTIASEGGLPPWNTLTSTGELTGFEIDLGHELCRRMRYDCQFVAHEWESMIPALRQGKYDAIMAGMVITEERLKSIAFAGPYAFGPSQLATMLGNDVVELSADTPERIDLAVETPMATRVLERLSQMLRGKRIGVQAATVQAAFVERFFPGATVHLYNTLQNAGLDLLASRVDAVFLDRGGLEDLLRNGQDRVVPFGPSFVRGPLGRGVAIGLRQEDTALKQAFDRAIAEAAADGTVRTLSMRHFGYDVTVEP